MKKRSSCRTADSGVKRLAEEILAEKSASETSSEQERSKNECIFKNVDSKWGWKEELFLLESVEQSGLFNWERIASRLSHESKTSFNAEEVQDHFFKHYLHGTLGQVWNYQLVGKQVEQIDHTEYDRIDASATKKYLPAVHKQNCKSIKFFPHREEFEEYPDEDIETLVTTVDFSSFYMTNLKNLNIEQEVRDLQLALIDSYCQKVAERMELYKFMKNFKLIEQFTLNVLQRQQRPTALKNCELEKIFRGMQNCISLFESSTEFLNFYFNCVKEKLLKLEIDRLRLNLLKKEKKERCSEMESLLKGKAPFFLNVEMLLSSDKSIVLYKSKKRKRRPHFTTKRKRTR